MSILTRKEICNLVKEGSIIDGETINKEISSDYSNSSSIQPCSVYLHIGEIFMPEQKNESKGSETNPILDHYLEPGEVIFVRTEEKLKIPSDLGGICFAPTHFSLKGLLIINIGHIDPGYEGKLNFNVVNLGKEKILLQRGSLIAKLLLFKLTKETNSRGPEEYIKINNKDVPEAVHNSLPYLSKSFMNINDTTEKKVKARFKLLSFLIPALSATLAAAIAICLPIVFGLYGTISSLQEKTAAYETKIEDLNYLYSKDIQGLSAEISDLEITNQMYIKDIQNLLDRVSVLEKSAEK